MTYWQYELESTDFVESKHKVCFLDKKVEVGSVVTLKDVPGRWKVIRRHCEIDSKILDMNRNPEWYHI